MDTVLTGAVFLIVLLLFLNLLLTRGVIRRLREHDRRLDIAESGAPLGEPEPTVGAPVPMFTATTTDHGKVSHGAFADGRTFVGFFSTSCQPCLRQLRQFADLVGSSGQDDALFVINDDGEAPETLEALLDEAEGAGRVILEAQLGPTTTAFGVHRMPTLLAIDDGTVTANCRSTAELSRSTRSVSA